MCGAAPIRRVDAVAGLILTMMQWGRRRQGVG